MDGRMREVYVWEDFGTLCLDEVRIYMGCYKRLNVLG